MRLYAKYIKRPLDCFLSFLAITVLSPLLLILTAVGAVAMKGNPFFLQLRPGKNEKIFKMVKFRTMTVETDTNGVLLPDEKRLTGYGKLLRSTSLDELPELFNIFVGDMAVIGPRPQLVRDMVFMTEEQRKRHTVRPGLSGLAQANGRNAIGWEQKLNLDLVYIQHITFWGDCKLILKTIQVTLIRKDISEDGMETAEDLGDYLLNSGVIDHTTYENAQLLAKELIVK